MEWKDYLQANGWSDQGICMKCGYKWKWSKGSHLIKVIGSQHTMFTLQHKGKPLGTFKIYELQEKTKDI